MCVICRNRYSRVNKDNLCRNCHDLLCYAYNFEDPIWILRRLIRYLRRFQHNDTELSLQEALSEVVVHAFPITRGGKKECSRCGETYEATNEFFYKNKGRRDGFDPWCKRCKRAYDQEYYIRKTYGMDGEAFTRKLYNQNNRCSICGREFTLGLGPKTDHDHEKNMVRDFLCNCCNLLIGCAYEDIEILERAIRYLKRFQK